MSLQPPIPGPLWEIVPSDAQAAILAAWDAMRQRLAQLEQRVRDLEARLKLNSTNSSKPPSSDPIGLKRKPPSPRAGASGAVNPGIARPPVPWSRPSGSGRPLTASPRRAGAAVRPCTATTPPP
jgi:transposase